MIAKTAISRVGSGWAASQVGVNFSSRLQRKSQFGQRLSGINDLIQPGPQKLCWPLYRGSFARTAALKNVPKAERIIVDRSELNRQKTFRNYRIPGNFKNKSKLAI
jgi:hypothetical protein